MWRVEIKRGIRVAPSCAVRSERGSDGWPDENEAIPKIKLLVKVEYLVLAYDESSFSTPQF